MLARVAKLTINMKRFSDKLMNSLDMAGCQRAYIKAFFADCKHHELNEDEIDEKVNLINNAATFQTAVRLSFAWNLNKADSDGYFFWSEIAKNSNYNFPNEDCSVTIHNGSELKE